MPECLRGNDEPRWDGKPIKGKLLQEECLCPQEVGVIHLFGALGKQAEGKIRIIGQHVFDKFIRVIVDHVPQNADGICDEQIQLLNEKCGRKHIPEEFFHFHLDSLPRMRLGGDILLREHLGNDDGQRPLVDIQEIPPDDLAHILPQKLKNVNILAQGKTGGCQAVAEHLQVRFKALVVNTIQRKPLFEQKQHIVNMTQGFGREIFMRKGLQNLGHQLRYHAFQAVHKPQGFEFRLFILAVGGGNPRRNMPLILDVLKCLGLFGIQNDGLEVVHHLVEQSNGGLVAGAVQIFAELLQIVFCEEMGFFHQRNHIFRFK
ncbi:hypothetical protein SDC9_149827 [bioreactor metagenome]|uniref:Uncharacterized protein n=1 Tax=bioreactor metagenome TaxID=1076179 RepID=A0A645EKU1_9ZZZZ